MKARRQMFAQSVKAGAKAAGWRYANGGLFAQNGEWFLSIGPHLLWEQGAVASLIRKPMAADPLFWGIVGLPENERLPLSFRANGAWVLRPPTEEVHIALDEADPVRLATAVLDWSAEQLRERVDISISSLLAQLEALGPRRDHFVAFEICLRLLNRDVAHARALCLDRGRYDSGGYQTGERTFFDQALTWIDQTPSAT